MTGVAPCSNSVQIYFEELVLDPKASCRKYKKVYNKMMPYPHHWMHPNLALNNNDVTYVAEALKVGGIVCAAPNIDASGAFSTCTLDKKTQN